MFNPAYISGGSSSGSAVAVAAGLVSFALGTDTAGSGRVPAGFNNIVGLKPTPGVVSTHGVVPACRSLDCVSVFALTCEDATRVFDCMRGHDARDIYARSDTAPARALPVSTFRCGVPAPSQREFFGDDIAREAFERSLAALRNIGAELVDIDFSPFAETARLLYDGPWVAERYAAVGTFLEAHPDEVYPVTRQVIESARKWNATDTFSALYRLRELGRRCDEQWQQMDVLAVPTSGTIYTQQAIAEAPVANNTNLGYYTNFVNLLDLCALAVPGLFRADGLPAGVTLIAAAHQDHALAAIGSRLHRACGVRLGATDFELPAPLPNAPAAADEIVVAVGGRASVWLAAEPSTHLARCAPAAGRHDCAGVSPLCVARHGAAQAGLAARSARRHGGGGGTVGAVAGGIRRVRGRGAAAARHRHAHARRRPDGEGLFVRGLRHRRRAGHFAVWRLARLSRGAGAVMAAGAALYRGMDRAALDAAYDNTAAVAESAALLADFDARSAALRARLPQHLGLRYGPRDRNRIDYFAADKPGPILMFIHGGYWQMRAKETFSFVAEGPLAHGIHVALPGYTLAPAITLDGIVDELRAAIRWIAEHAASFGGDASRIIVSGWSAGGHLTAMLLDEPAVQGGLAISGIFDLEPVRLNYLNAKLQLDEAAVRRLSPLHRLSSSRVPLMLACGGG